MKHLQLYMAYFELDFRGFERQPQSEQISITFTPSMENIFETLETADVDMNPSQSIIGPIVNRNFLNTLHHQNGPNKDQRTNKNAIQQYHNSNTRQQYQHRNTGQQHQHRHHSQRYQPRSFHRPRASSNSYLKENRLGCGLNNKGVQELLMQHGGTLEKLPFRGTLYIHAKASREQHPHNNQGQMNTIKIYIYIQTNRPSSSNNCKPLYKSELSPI